MTDEKSFQKQEDWEPKTFSPNPYRFWLLFFCVSFFIIIGFGLLVTGKVLTGIILIAVPVIFLLFLYAQYSSKIPRLMLSPNGLEYVTLNGPQKWSWNEVGTFSAHSTKQIAAVVAYTDIHQDALELENKKHISTFYNADISLLVTEIVKFNSSLNANDIAKELNLWRERYGSPQNDAHSLSRVERSKIVAEVKSKSLKNKLLYFFHDGSCFHRNLFAQNYRMSFVPDLEQYGKNRLKNNLIYSKYIPQRFITIIQFLQS
jgi:hypothetical protein